MKASELLEGLTVQQEMTLYLQTGRRLIETLIKTEDIGPALLQSEVLRLECELNRNRLIENPPNIVPATPDEDDHSACISNGLGHHCSGKVRWKSTINGALFCDFHAAIGNSIMEYVPCEG